MNKQFNDPKLLLTTVTGPYGIENEEVDGVGMQMELLNNQITRHQGIHSPRSNFWTFPLYFIAENISVRTTILDFPDWKQFVAELKKGYTHVGISFIQMNVYKVQRMAEFIRRHYPGTRIILGGYGTAVPKLSDLVPCDAVCEGEGIRWMRRYFGENPDRPIRHPIMHGVAQKTMYGFHDRIDDSAVIFPGLGCPNACFFCATSAKFGHRYIPFLKTGRDVFAVCEQLENDLGVTAFAIIDENFLKSPERARELVRLMEARQKTYTFSMFSSAEAISELGIDFLVRMGVALVWVGVESRKSPFAKTSQVNIARLIRDLQANGIAVIGSSILFLEHHDRHEIQKDIDWAMGLHADMHQFMQLVPLPGTPLYAQYKEKGLLPADDPYKSMHGQGRLTFRHPHFAADEAARITSRAFRKNYQKNGPGILNMAKTALNGYQRLQQRLATQPDPASGSTEAYMQLRLQEMKKRAMVFRVTLPTLFVFSPNRHIRKRAAALAKAYITCFGPESRRERLRSLALVAIAGVEWIRRKIVRLLTGHELVRQPPSRRWVYERRKAEGDGKTSAIQAATRLDPQTGSIEPALKN